MMKLYEIKEKAVKTGRAVFNISQLSNLIGKPKETAKVYLNRLINKGLAIKIRKGVISFTDDQYIIATQLIEPSYISLHTALLYHQKIQQVPKYIQCITTINSIKLENLGIIYHKVKPSIFFGFKRKRKGDSYIHIATPEKALFDALYLNQMSQEEAEEIIELLNIKEFEKIVKRARIRKIKRWLKSYLRKR